MEGPISWIRYGTYRVKCKERNDARTLQVASYGIGAQHVFLPFLISHPRQSQTTPKNHKKSDRHPPSSNDTHTRIRCSFTRAFSAPLAQHSQSVSPHSESRSVGSQQRGFLPVIPVRTPVFSFPIHPTLTRKCSPKQAAGTSPGIRR